MKFRMVIVFIAVAIATLFATSCGGDGGGGGGDYDYDRYTDDSGYGHEFGGMEEGLYEYYDDQSGHTHWLCLESDGGWYNTVDGSNCYRHLKRYTIEEDGLHFLIKTEDSGWSNRYIASIYTETSFTIDGRTYTLDN